VEFKILGPLEACDRGGALRLGPPKQRAVLAVLLVHANQVVSVDRLIDVLWGGRPPARAGGGVQAYVHNLRRVLEPARRPRSSPSVLLTVAPGYVLRVGSEHLDAARFQALAAEGRRLLAENDPEPARERLTEALALWRGPALTEFAHEPFARAEAARLDELREVAIEDRLEAELATGGQTGAVPELEALVGRHPLRERLWGLLMLALYRSGRQGDALRAAAQARRVLGRELGVEPGPGLRRIEADILAQAASLEPRRWSEHLPPLPVPATTLSPVSRGGLDALVGREQPLATLLGAMDGARTGRGRLVLVSGEAGIGKTRLVEEVAAHAHATGVPVAWGRGYEGGGTPAFWPWVQVIQSLLERLDPDVARAASGSAAGEIAQIAPELGELVGAAAMPAIVDPAAARFRLYLAMTAVLRRLAADRPVLVLLDDLHWFDVASLELTRFLATHVEPAALVLVATYRPGEVPADSPLASTMSELARLPRVTRLGLSGLSESEVARFIEQKTSAEPSAAVVADVHRRTDGNPFFVTELARLLSAEGVLGTSGGIGTRIPAGVRDVISRRLARLPKRTTDLLGAGAVVGPQFDLAVVASAVELDQPAALELMDLAVASGIVSEDPDTVDGYRFAHTLLQETVYAELGRGRRARLHARVAENLEARWGADPGRAVELAEHWFRAASLVGPEPGIAAAVRAAEVAQARLAYEQAEDELGRALDLIRRLTPGPDRVRWELSAQNRLAGLLTLTQGFASERVAQAWRRARDLCRDTSMAPDVLPPLWGLFTTSIATLQLRAAAEVAAQLRELGRSGTGLARLAGHLASGIERFHAGDLVAARQEGEHAIAAWHPADDPDVLLRAFSVHPAVVAHGYVGLARWLLGDRPEARLMTGRAVDIAERHGPGFGRDAALYFDGWLAILDRDVAAVRRRVEQITSDQHGSQEATGLAMTISGWLRGLDDYTGGRADLRRTITSLMDGGYRLSGSLFLALLADLDLRAQRPAAALAAAEEGLAHVEATGERCVEAELHRLRGEALAHIPERREEAERSLRKAMAVAESQQAVSLQERAGLSLSRLEQLRRAQPKGRGDAARSGATNGHRPSRPEDLGRGRGG
jgi:DNA-binding SARP family transcriptional activator/tetratricopeptide (TPR) repeat protein